MISVIIPVYNASRWLNKCLDSLLAQTIFDQLEIIAIDDGSVDDSGRILDDYAEKYDNILVHHIPNGGVSNARNLGIDLCHGEYVAFVDADDYVEPDFLEHLLDGMKEECDISCSGFLAEYPDRCVRRCPSEKMILNHEEAMEAFLLAGSLEPNIWDKLFRREIIGDKRFDTRVAMAEDKLFLFYCLKDVRSITLLPEADYHYVILDGSACRNNFDKKNLHSIYVVDRITKGIRADYPELQDLARSMAMDVKCRIYADMYRNKGYKTYPKEYKRIRRSIRRFPLWKKMRYSNKKHTIAFMIVKISPRLYNYLKHDMKLQYKA